MASDVEPTITLTDEGERWVARHIETGVTSQGKTRSEALDNLDEALAGYRGDGREPTDEELRAAGIDPENNESGSIDDSEILD